jgi:FAD:protein FMN transferase
MGTLATISAPQSKQEVLQKGFERLSNVEKALSSYDNEAVIYRLNKALHVKLNSDSYEALSLSKRYYEQSDGYFDITIGSITKDAFRFGLDERVPSEEELQNSEVGFKALRFSQKEARLLKGYKVDLGGMGKGFGVDKVYEIYQESNVSEGKIALSGDIRCVGICNIKIANPFKEGVIAEFQSKKTGLAISTSGNYRRFVETKSANHLINPKQKCSAQNFASITLLSFTSNADIDAYATAASVMPKQQALKFLDTLPLGYIIYSTANELFISPNIQDYSRELIFY